MLLLVVSYGLIRNMEMNSLYLLKHCTIFGGLFTNNLFIRIESVDKLL